MGFCHRIIFSAGAAALGVVLGGCEPSAQSAADDEKEPHYVLGQNRVNGMDFPGAVEAFEASLEANPHSAKAHYRLAMLYEDETKIKPANPAAAIYHYQQYLRFDPKASNAEIVAGRIEACKMELAKNELGLPSSSAAQQQLQQLADTNRVLLKQLENYAREIAILKTNPPAPPENVAMVTPTTPEAPPARAVTAAKPSPAKARTHTVAARETPASIARKYDLSLNALLAANPGLNPKKLRVGQILKLPPP